MRILPLACRAALTLGISLLPAPAPAQSPPPVCAPYYEQSDFPCRLEARGRTCRDVSDVRGHVDTVLAETDVDGDHVDEILVGLNAITQHRPGPHECDTAPHAFERLPLSAHENTRYVIESRRPDGLWTGWSLGRVPNGDRGNGNWIEPIHAGTHVYFGTAISFWVPWVDPHHAFPRSSVELFELRPDPLGVHRVFSAGDMSAWTVFAPIGANDVLAVDARRGYRVLRWHEGRRRLTAGPWTRAPSAEALASLRRVPEGGNVCAVPMRTAFHLRPTADADSEGPELPAGVVVIVEEAVDSVHRGGQTLYRLRLPGGSSGFGFLPPSEVPGGCRVAGVIRYTDATVPPTVTQIRPPTPSDSRGSAVRRDRSRP